MNMSSSIDLGKLGRPSGTDATEEELSLFTQSEAIKRKRASLKAKQNLKKLQSTSTLDIPEDDEELV
jgi:hypothetical protein